MSTQALASTPADATSPTVSVLMPAYNVAAYLHEAVASILSQTWGDFELVVVDDGSTDGTREMLRAAAATDARIRLIEMPTNGGIVAALNEGLAACRGRYIARMDADDVALPHRLASQVAAMRAADDVVALGAALEYIDEQGRPLGVTRRCELDRPLSVCPLLHPTVMLRASTLLEQRLAYRPDFRMAEDYCLWLELRRCGRLAATDEVLLKYRLRRDASRMRHLKRMLRATLRTKGFAVRRLGMRPTAADLLRGLAECGLLITPAAVVRWLYLRKMFGSRRGLRL